MKSAGGGSSGSGTPLQRHSATMRLTATERDEECGNARHAPHSHFHGSHVVEWMKRVAAATASLPHSANAPCRANARAQEALPACTNANRISLRSTPAMQTNVAAIRRTTPTPTCHPDNKGAPQPCGRARTAATMEAVRWWPIAAAAVQAPRMPQRHASTNSIVAW